MGQSPSTQEVGSASGLEGVVSPSLTSQLLEAHNLLQGQGGGGSGLLDVGGVVMPGDSGDDDGGGVVNPTATPTSGGGSGGGGGISLTQALNISPELLAQFLNLPAPPAPSSASPTPTLSLPGNLAGAPQPAAQEDQGESPTLITQGRMCMTAGF